MRALTFVFFLMLSTESMAGIYGSENWGEMYWGDNPATAPTGLPAILSAVATEDQITITLGDFPAGTGEDGWSRVTSYTVTCGEVSVSTSESAVTIEGLRAGTDYACEITANNAQGEGPVLVELVTTESANTVFQGLDIMLICSAIDCTVNS